MVEILCFGLNMQTLIDTLVTVIHKRKIKTVIHKAKI